MATPQNQERNASPEADPAAAASQASSERSESPELDLAAQSYGMLQKMKLMIAQLEKNLITSERERLELEEKTKANPSAQTDVHELQKRCKELEQDRTKAEARISQMQINYHRLSKDSESQINKLQEQLRGYDEMKKLAEGYQKDIQKRIVEANALKKKAAASGELQTKIRELETKVSTLGSLEKELEEMKKELEADKKERAFLERKVEEFKARTKQLDNWEKIQEDLARARTARDDYQRRVEELEMEMVSLKLGKH